MALEFRQVRLAEQDRALPHSPWPALNRLSGLASLTIVGSPALVALALAAKGHSSGAVLLAAFVAGGCVAAWWAVCSTSTKSAGRLYAETPIGAAPLNWRFDPAGLVQSSSMIRTELPWEAVVDVVEEADRFLFLVTPYLTLVLPKRFAGREEIAALRGYISAARQEGRIKGLPGMGSG